MPSCPRTLRGCGYVAALVLAALGAAARGQPPAPPPTPSAPLPRSADTSNDGGLTVRDTSAGYIDNPLPLDQVFLRTDNGFRFARPNRAEFFYAQSRPGGPG